LVLLAEIILALFAHRTGPAFANRDILAAGQPNIVALGQLLYSRYLFAFELAGLMLLVGAEFIAMLVVIVYVGAVAVLFLFVVMMLDIDFATLRSGFTRNLPFGIIVALVLLGEVVIASMSWQAGPTLSRHAIPEATQPNIVALGQLLYTRYLFAFELAGLILLVAMIGAIVLTHRKRRDTRPQKAWKQIGRRPGEAIRLVEPGVGEGMTL
jgi:NADH-quinone oxidoreductase subunit J